MAECCQSALLELAADVVAWFLLGLWCWKLLQWSGPASPVDLAVACAFPPAFFLFFGAHAECGGPHLGMHSDM